MMKRHKKEMENHLLSTINGVRLPWMPCIAAEAVAFSKGETLDTSFKLLILNLLQRTVFGGGTGVSRCLAIPIALAILLLLLWNRSLLYGIYRTAV